MSVRFPSVGNVRELPELLTQAIPAEWEDYNGHVNIQYYMRLYEQGGWPLVGQLGLDESYFRDRRCGLFDLEHHLFYLSEVYAGDEVSVHCRLLDKTAKRFHGMMFLLNQTRNALAGTMEFVTSGADLDARRTAVFPDDIAVRISAMVDAQRGLDWDAPVCGVMSA